MRAKFVNESLNRQDVPLEEVIEFAKEAAARNPLFIFGPCVEEMFKRPGEYAVRHGGVSCRYNPEEIDELINAIETVQEKDTNVTWRIYQPSPDSKNTHDVPRISFDSDEERKTGEDIARYYSRSGSYTGD